MPRTSKSVVQEEQEEEIVQSTNENSEVEETEEDDDERVPIDLTQNEIYRGVCTLLEDEEGNNILEYISLLHTELIGINKSLENLKPLRKDINRLADCAELLLKSQKIDVPSSNEEKKEEKKHKTKTSTKV
jgi:hypothetical protein